jgi:hypothetical protein
MLVKTYNSSASERLKGSFQSAESLTLKPLSVPRHGSCRRLVATLSQFLSGPQRAEKLCLPKIPISRELRFVHMSLAQKCQKVASESTVFGQHPTCFGTYHAATSLSVFAHWRLPAIRHSAFGTRAGCGAIPSLLCHFACFWWSHDASSQPRLGSAC